MSSGRSILVAPTVSAACRVNTATSAGDMPGMYERAEPSALTVSSGFQDPLPANFPEAGGVPVPSTGSGESPVKVAT